MLGIQQKKKSYATSGVQMGPGVKMNVSIGVRLPDSEAGMEPDDGRKPFQYAAPMPNKAKDPPQMPLRLAVALLCALMIALSVPVIRRVSKTAALQKQLSDVSAQIESLSILIEKQQIQVAEGRQKSVITYAASHLYHLQDPTGVVPEMVTAPDTRPYRSQGTSDVLNEHLSGSR